MKEKMQEILDDGNMSEKQLKKLKMRKKLKYGSIATAVTAVVIVVIILVNVLVSMLADVRLDLTSNNVYDVSDETIDYVKNLDKDVDIAISVEKDTLKSLLGTSEMMISETLSKYEDYSDHISVTYFDTTKDPDVLSKYQTMYGGDIGSGAVIVSCGDRVKVSGVLDMFDIDSNMYYAYMRNQCEFPDIITGYKGEQMLTNAIMNVTDVNVKHVGLIEKANGEYIFSLTDGNVYAMNSLNDLLDDNGYDVERDIDITSAELSPEDYDILILPAPVNDLSVDATKRLSDFMYNDGKYGKNMLYIADYTQGDTPNLDAFLKDWNISVSKSVVSDSEDKSQVVNTYDILASGRSMIAPSVTIATTDYSSGLENASLPIVVPLGRPIVEEKLNNGKVVIPLWQTSEGSVELALKGSDLSESETSEKRSRMMACMVQNQVNNNGEICESNLFVLPSISTIDSMIISDAAYNNGTYVISALNTICGKEATSIIATKNLSAATLDITTEKIDAIKWVVWFVIPVIVIAAGIAVALRRRKR